MITLQAPLPGIATTTYLPNPTFGDTEGISSTLTVKRSMNGLRRTYVKKVLDRELSYTFRLTRMKGLELRAFILEYFDSKIKLTNHKNEVWEVYFINNPFEFQQVRRWMNSPGNEETGINLQFRGRKVS